MFTHVAQRETIESKIKISKRKSRALTLTRIMLRHDKWNVQLRSLSWKQRFQITGKQVSVLSISAHTSKHQKESNIRRMEKCLTNALNPVNITNILKKYSN